MKANTVNKVQEVEPINNYVLKFTIITAWQFIFQKLFNNLKPLIYFTFGQILDKFKEISRSCCSTLAQIWKLEIRTFSPFWPSESFLGSSRGMSSWKIFEFSLSGITENSPNLLTLIKSVYTVDSWLCSRFASTE